MACDISSYNVQGYIHKLDTLETYEFPFERLRRVEESYTGGKKSKMMKNSQGKMVPVNASDSESEEEKDELDVIKEEEEDEAPTEAPTADETQSEKPSESA